MKKYGSKKLRLSRQTLHRLDARGGGGACTTICSQIVCETDLLCLPRDTYPACPWTVDVCPA